MDPLSLLFDFLATGPGAALTTLRGLLGVLLGVGALIFFHELGHFLAAKWAGVRVDVFSLGMGPRLFGVVHGDTDYRVSALPIGGYVSMLGQVDGDPDQPRTERDDDFRNKSVEKRFVIMVAGVVMNLVLAAVGFVLCFGLGVDFAAAEVGAIEPGSAASRADLRRGDVVTHVDGGEVLGFQDLGTLAAIADGEIELTVVRDGRAFKTKATPVRGPNDRFARLGVSLAYVVGDVQEGTPFWDAGLRPSTPTRGLHWLNVSAVDSRCAPDTVMKAPAINRALGDLQGRVVATFEEVHYDESGRPQGRELKQFEVDLERKPIFHLGLAIPDQAWIRSVKEGSAAAKAGIREGDRLVEIAGRPVTASNLSQAVRRAGALAAETQDHRVGLVVERKGERQSLEAVLAPQNPQVIERALEGVKGDAARLEVVEEVGQWLLGVIYAADVVAEPCTLPLADAKADPVQLQPGDRFTRIWVEEGTFLWGGERTFDRSRVNRMHQASRLKVAWLPKGASEERTAVVQATQHPTATRPVLGFDLQMRQVTIQRSPLNALWLGLEQTMIQTRRIALMLGAFLTGAVSPRELGGPIQIVNVTYKFASQDSLSKLLHLLAILSVNLAVINILPIPILDGGHIFFLAIEKLKGKPVSTEILMNAQWFGLFCIVGLMALVIFNDIRRLLGS